MADEKTPESTGNQITRREFLGGVAKGVAVGAAGAVVGFGVGREVQYRHENPSDLTGEPFEIQIRKLELRSEQEGLRNENLRNNYTFLICAWYGANHSFGAFADPDNEYAAAQKMYSSISFIVDEKDPRLQGYENSAGWAVPRESIMMNLTLSELKETYLFNTTGSRITPFMQMRDTLVHELTHFIVEERKSAQIIAVVKGTKPEFANISDITISGFRMYFDPDPNDPKVNIIPYLGDFDEASTELIANYYQRAAGLAVGLPSYPEHDQTANQYRIEKTIDNLEATLKFSGISMDQFAQLHATSDLDGLARAFADSINRTFSDDIEKIRYGLSVIDASRTLDFQLIGQHIKEKKS